MKLSSEVIIGLKRLCNPSLVSEENFHRITEECIRAVLGKADSKGDLSQLFDTRLDIMKGAYAAFTVLLVECVRRGTDENTLSTELKACNINPQRMSYLIELYEKCKPDVRLKLSSFNDNLPHIIDVHWRLDYCVKTNEVPSKYQHLFHIDFIVLHPGKGQRKIRIVCTLQHLQELTYILKGMVKYINRVSNYRLK